MKCAKLTRFLLSGVLALSVCFTTVQPLQVQAAWKSNSIGWWWTEGNSYVKNDWRKISGSWYYFEQSGYMATGWKNLNGTWYYLNGNGAMATGWKNLNGTWYYLNDNGAMATGWKNLNGTWYYLNSNGAMAIGWKNLNGTWYYLNGNGAMAIGWKNLNGTWYYLNGSGAMVTGWQTINGTLYHFNTSGAMSANTTIDGYVIDKNGAATKQEPVVHEHQYGEWVVEKEATYTEPGVRVQRCTTCNTVLAQEEIPVVPHEHAWVVDNHVDSTCITAGYDVQRCSLCGRTKTVMLPLVSHIANEGVIESEPTDFNEGVKKFYCVNCGEYMYSETIPALGHTTHHYEEKIIKEPTCTDAGLKKVTCVDCNETQELEIPATGHSYGDWVIVTPATDLTSGLKVKTCSKCGATSEEVIEKLPHEHSYEATITKFPTREEEGIKTYTCPCGDTYTESIPKLEHNYVLTNKTDATCTTDAVEEYTCEICGDSYETVVENTAGHTFGDWIVTIEPTCDCIGIAERQCSKCERDETKILEPTGHAFGDWKVTKEKTCMESGEEERVCTKCGKVEKRDINAPMRHTFGDWTVVTEQTCFTEDGLEKHVCTECGETETRVIPAGHTPGEWETITPPTTSNPGIKMIHCKKCGEVLDTEEIPVLDDPTGTVSKVTVDMYNGETKIVYGIYDEEMSAEILNMMNEYRTEYNKANGTRLSMLSSGNQNLQEAAKLRAAEITINFDHERPNGLNSVMSLFKTTGSTGENIARGYQSSEAVMNAWKNSTGHNENLLRTTFNSCAVSVFKIELSNGEYSYYYVQLFSNLK